MASFLDILAEQNQGVAGLLDAAKYGKSRVGLHIDSIGSGDNFQRSLNSDAARGDEGRSIVFIGVKLPSTGAATPRTLPPTTRAIVEIGRQNGLLIHYYWLLSDTGGIPRLDDAYNQLAPLLSAINTHNSDVLFIHYNECHVQDSNNAPRLLELLRELPRRLDVQVGLRSDSLVGIKGLCEHFTNLRQYPARRVKLCYVHSPPIIPVQIDSPIVKRDKQIESLVGDLLPRLPGGQDYYCELASQWLELSAGENEESELANPIPATVRLVFANS